MAEYLFICLFIYLKKQGLAISKLMNKVCKVHHELCICNNPMNKSFRVGKRELIE
jgi:hypothetical protein